jgi:transposase-like protein
LSFRDVEDLLAERGIVVSYETVRCWVNHFGRKIGADLRKRRPKPHTNLQSSNKCGILTPYKVNKVGS